MFILTQDKLSLLSISNNIVNDFLIKEVGESFTILLKRQGLINEEKEIGVYSSKEVSIYVLKQLKERILIGGTYTMPLDDDKLKRGVK